jgi:hypothetical protein
MKRPAAADLIDVLACDIGVRPNDAPTFEDVAPYIREVRRDERAISVLFDKGGLRIVEALVAAEQRCCADLAWDLEREPDLRLRIGASPAQLDVLEQMLS